MAVSHVLMGTAMMATGLVANFQALVATQMLWGISWNLASGADVAWITDELDDPIRIAGVLVHSGRAQLTGAAAGLVALGCLAAAIQRGAAMVTAGGIGRAEGFIAHGCPTLRTRRSSAAETSGR
jgi:hypothetical protein